MQATKSLFEQGYRVGALHEGEGFVRVYRAGTGSYKVSLLDMTCACKSFKYRRSCVHLDQMADMIEGTVAEMRGAFKVIETEVKSGRLNFRQVDRLNCEGQSIFEETCALSHALRLISTETVLEVLA